MATKEIPTPAHLEVSSVPLWRLGQELEPTGLASACLADFHDHRVLLTVRHAVGDMKDWGLVVRFEPDKGTQLHRLGAMNFLNKGQGNISQLLDHLRSLQNSSMLEPQASLSTALHSHTTEVDIAYVGVPDEVTPLFQEVDASGSIRQEVPRMIHALTCDAEPNTNEFYGFSGQIQPVRIGGRFFRTCPVTYRNLHYVGTDGDYLVFSLPNAHPGHEYFRGCSGAPILDSRGNVVALVSSGNTETACIYGISLKKYKTALDVTFGRIG